MTHRVFFALWPPESVARALAEWQAALPHHTGRLVPRHNLHLTLAFAGDVTPETLACLRAGAETVRGEPVTVDLVQCGRFGPLLWAGPESTPEPLAHLATTLAGVLEDCGLPRDPRPYRPHVTLVRALRQELAVAPPATGWRSDEFCLAESRRGEPYRILQRFPLN
ncbi:MAG: RNA 2',3'-cyclic phosphodiesterase [Pseudomonadota bacterium]